MKKSLLLVALLGTFGAVSNASAQTSVTMYGTVDAGIAYNKGSADAGTNYTLESGQQSYSRIGFRGVEDLGSGMKALFVLEQAVQIDTGASGYKTMGSNLIDNSNTFSSQAFVGLSSNVAGTVTLGTQFSPLYNAYLAIDPFQNGFAANINNFFGNIPGVVVGEPNGSFSPFQRMQNSIVYSTPDNLGGYVSGFKGSLAYSFGEVPGSNGTNNQYGVSLGYVNGPLTIAYAFHHANLSLFNDFPSFRTNFIGASWDFGAAKVHGAFDQNEIVNGVMKTQDYMIGITVPLDNSSVFADYTHKKDKSGGIGNANQFGIGYTYNLSKRTNLYAAYTWLKNDSNSSINADRLGATVNTVQLGVRHQF